MDTSTRYTALAIARRLAQSAREMQADESGVGRPFLSPLTTAGRARLRLHGMIYELRVAKATPGWWICRMTDPLSAIVDHAAPPWLRDDYLALWPARQYLLVEPLAADRWVAIPCHPHMGKDGNAPLLPVIMHLVEGGDVFDQVIGRVEGSTVWYDRLDMQADPRRAAEMRVALAEGRPPRQLRQSSPSAMLAYVARLAGPLDGQVGNQGDPLMTIRLRTALEIGGARLIRYQRTARGLEVTWERGGMTAATLVADDLHVIAAGICLSDQDAQFDLTSVVGIIAESPPFAR